MFSLTAIDYHRPQLYARPARCSNVVANTIAQACAVCSPLTSSEPAFGNPVISDRPAVVNFRAGGPLKPGVGLSGVVPSFARAPKWMPHPKGFVLAKFRMGGDAVDNRITTTSAFATNAKGSFSHVSSQKSLAAPGASAGEIPATDGTFSSFLDE
jgi:hypothetical protein